MTPFASESSGDRALPLTEQPVRDAIGSAADLVWLLKTANRADRAELYRALGLRLRYTREAATGNELVHARLQLWAHGARQGRMVSGGGVGSRRKLNVRRMYIVLL